MGIGISPLFGLIIIVAVNGFLFQEKNNLKMINIYKSIEGEKNGSQLIN